MTRKKRMIELQIDLSGETKERFLAIKRAKGLADDEVLQLMINEYFEKLAADKTHK